MAELARSVFLSMAFFTNVRTGTRARAMILTLVYDKVSKLRNVGDRSIGEVYITYNYTAVKMAGSRFVTSSFKHDSFILFCPFYS